MPRYSWEGRTAAGQLVSGELEAPSREAASQSLQSKRIMVIRVEERPGPPGASPVEPSPPRPARARRDGESLRDRFFPFGIAAAAAAVSVGIQLVCADGTRWRSPNSSWPLGSTVGDVRSGIQGLLDAPSPASYHAWVGDKVARVVALAFLTPIGFILLGLPLRLVIPRSWVDQRLSTMAARARRRQGSK